MSHSGADRPLPEPAIVRGRIRSGKYAGLRLYVVATLLALSVGWGLLVVLQRFVPEPRKAAVSGIHDLGLPWLSEVLDRLITDDGYKIVMVALFMGLLLYTVLQFLGISSDRSRLLASGDGTPNSATGMAQITGRPASLYDAALSSRAWTTHFSAGRDALLAPLNIGFWLFPSLGFLGTVIGISKAIQKLPEALPAPTGGPPKRPESLNDVFAGLHFAFDTTFLGLVASIIIVAITAYFGAAWDRNEVLWREVSGEQPPSPPERPE